MKALDRGQTPTITPDLTDELFIVQVDADGVARDGRASIGTLLEATASSQFLPVSGTKTGVAAELTQAAYGVDVSVKGGWAALKLNGQSSATANKAPLQLYSPKSSPAGEDVLFSADFAGNGFNGPITIIKADGGIESGAYLVISGHGKNSGSSSGYKSATYKRTMATVWTDTPGAAADEANVVLSLRNVGASYPSGDGGNCDVLLIVEDAGTSTIADGKERLAIRPKGDIYQMLTDHTTDWSAATNYERGHLGWDRTNSRYVLETQAGGSGTRRELLVKDRKLVTMSAAATISATTTLGYWVAPRDCKIKAGTFINETGFGVSGAAFWRAAATLYISGAYSGDILNRGNDSAIISTLVGFDMGTPASTTILAGQVLRIFLNKVAGAPSNIVNPTITFEWEPV